jgi:hypothetical protein
MDDYAVTVIELVKATPEVEELIPVHTFSGGIEETYYYPKQLVPDVSNWSTRDLWQWIYREGHDECITGNETRVELIEHIKAFIALM